MSHSVNKYYCVYPLAIQVLKMMRWVAWCTSDASLCFECFTLSATKGDLSCSEMKKYQSCFGNQTTALSSEAGWLRCAQFGECTSRCTGLQNGSFMVVFQESNLTFLLDGGRIQSPANQMTWISKRPSASYGKTT